MTRSEKEYRSGMRWVANVKILIEQSDKFFEDIAINRIPQKDWKMVFGKTQAEALKKMNKALKHLRKTK